MKYLHPFKGIRMKFDTEFVINKTEKAGSLKLKENGNNVLVSRGNNLRFRFFK